jgi:hypothetical protein
MCQPNNPFKVKNSKSLATFVVLKLPKVNIRYNTCYVYTNDRRTTTLLNVPNWVAGLGM